MKVLIECVDKLQKMQQRNPAITETMQNHTNQGDKCKYQKKTPTLYVTAR